MSVCEHERHAKRHAGRSGRMMASLAAAATVMYACRSARITIHSPSLLPFPGWIRLETVKGLSSETVVAPPEGFLDLGCLLQLKGKSYRWGSVT